MAIPLICLGIVSAVLYNSQRGIDEEERAARHIEDVRNQIQTVLTLLLNAETGVRGFDLSEDRDFLAPYSEAFDRLPRALSSLEALTGDDPEQLARAERVRFLAGRKLEALAVIRGTSFGELNTPSQQQALQDDNDLMQELRDVLAVMRQTEENRLEARLESLRDARESQPVVFGTALGIGLLGGLIAMWLFTTGIWRRINRLEESAKRLARGEPLLPRPPGSDELGRLAQALQEASDLLSDREHRLVTAKESAELASSAKSDFLSRTSHELRTPLTAIRGLAMTLHNMEHNEVVHDALGRIVHASENLTRLMNDFIDISRIEAGVLHFDIQDVALPTLLSDAVKLLGPRAEEKGITLTLEGTDDIPAVRADPQRLEQILYNLIGNAIKYNDQGGSVRVACSQPQSGRVRIAVVDDGPGIPDEKLPRLFTPYDRLGAENTGEKGVGLGLPISKSLAELMDGELSVESREGAGSTFYIDLPAAS